MIDSRFKKMVRNRRQQNQQKNHYLILKQGYFQLLILAFATVIMYSIYDNIFNPVENPPPPKLPPSFTSTTNSASVVRSGTESSTAYPGGGNLKGGIMNNIKAVKGAVMPLEGVTGMLIEGMELFYMIPHKKKVKGILIFFHGCNHGGQDMFYLPEDRIVAKKALDHGLAVLSPTSINRETGCWNKNENIEKMVDGQVLEQWLHAAGLSPDLPRMGIGCSSGGSLLFSAYEVLDLRSMVSYVMAKNFPRPDLKDKNKRLPATGYVYMPRDTESKHKIPEYMSRLSARNVPRRTWEVTPHPLTPQVCGQRIPELGEKRCKIILNYVQTHHEELLDKEYNILEPYSNGAWDEAFYKLNLDNQAYNKLNLDPAELQKEAEEHKKHRKSYNVTGEVSEIQFSKHSWLWAAFVEEIAVCYGKHEMTAEYIESVLDFLMTNAGV